MPLWDIDENCASAVGTGIIIIIPEVRMIIIPE